MADCLNGRAEKGAFYFLLPKSTRREYFDAQTKVTGAKGTGSRSVCLPVGCWQMLIRQRRPSSQTPEGACPLCGVCSDLFWLFPAEQAPTGTRLAWVVLSGLDVGELCLLFGVGASPLFRAGWHCRSWVPCPRLRGHASIACPNQIHVWSTTSARVGMPTLREGMAPS